VRRLVYVGLALLLAAVGIYGVVSCLVSQRTREIGMRAALGASRGDVLRQVLLECLALAASGLAIGIPMALASSRLLSSVLYGSSSTDPVSLLVGIAILAAVATLAGYIPARRATKVEPMVALRYE